MRTAARRLSVQWKALRQLGAGQMGLYALYRFGLWSGHYRRLTPVGGPRNAPAISGALDGLFRPQREALAALLGEDGRTRLLAEAEEILAGRVRLFGAEPVPLELAVTGAGGHWTQYEGVSAWSDGRDVKWTWEPARFGWIYPLARAYRLTGDERFAEGGWRWMESFWQANPPNQGPQWTSAQEVAIRLLGMVFAVDALGDSASTTPARRSALSGQVAAHARRILPTLVYARSQNNNHLLSEAVGLFTAGVFLSGKEAESWRRLGWKWLVWCCENQIRPDGTYVQHSANYHRLMLDLALWAARIADGAGMALPDLAKKRLAAAIGWLAGQVDPLSGEMTNLGANDGARLFPLAEGGFRDARPILQAAGRRFAGHTFFQSGAWDETGLWLLADPKTGDASNATPHETTDLFSGPGRVNHPGQATWVYLRAAQYHERPSHADQLHLDVWWRGLNLARDAGTYLYNGESPWDNRLSGTWAHNTISVDGQDQMLRAGRFLWLDWARAEYTQHAAGEICAVQDGYRRLGVRHERRVIAGEEPTWRVIDTLTAAGAQSTRHKFRLHWLVPDWQWAVDGLNLSLASPLGWIRIGLGVQAPGMEPGSAGSGLTLARAGQRIYGSGEVHPQDGWYSPTYTVRQPALSVSLEWQASLPTQAISEFYLNPTGD